MLKRKQAKKIPVVCARCGWRGKRSSQTIWTACPQCGARADLIVPQDKQRVADRESLS
jgi:predicted  nucleic acid-binding Zn-ribbon protein